jgi:nitroreductase
MKIKDRRTIRKYKEKEVDENLLKELLTTASRAATMGNMQLYSVVVTKEEKIKSALSPYHFNQPMVNAPVLLTFCCDFNRFSKWCEIRDSVPGYNNFLSFINSMSDTLLFTQNFCTLAEEAGLGTCYLGTTVYNPLGIIEVLHLPKLTFPIATISVGWPDETPSQPDRLPLEGIIHQEVYRDYSAESLDKIYAHKESLEENKEFIRVNSKKTLAQVFTDCRYTRSDDEAMSATLLEALRRQGFLQ